MTIVLVYQDPSSLLADWRRGGCWRHLPGATAVSHSAHLEKTNEGRPWLDFGFCVCRGRNHFDEPHENRISVPILAGGRNRGRIIKHLRQIPCVSIVFTLLTTPATWDEFFTELAIGKIGPTAGTERLFLDGLFIFGHRYRTGQGTWDAALGRPAY